MHHAKLDKSDRLQRVAKLLSDGEEHTTREIIQITNVCAVNSIISELRDNGVNIPPARRIRQGVYGYRIAPMNFAHDGKTINMSISDAIYKVLA